MWRPDPFVVHNGISTGFLPADQSVARGKQLSVNSNGRLDFVYRAGNTPGNVTIRVYIGYGQTGLVGEIGAVSINLTNSP